MGFQLNAGQANPAFYPGAFSFDSLSPDPLSGTVNDWNPAGLSGVSCILARASAAATLNGLAGGTPNRQLLLINQSAFTITIAANAGASAAENRFAVAGTIVAGAGLLLIYNSALAMWVAAGDGGGGVSGITSVNGDTGPAVVLDAADVGAAPAGIDAAAVLTDGDETALFPNSRELLAGTGLSFDDTTPGERTINASGGGGTTFFSDFLAADDVVTTNVLANKLLAAALPAGNYAFEAWLACTQTSGSGEIQFAVFSDEVPLSNNFGVTITQSDTGPNVQFPSGSPFQSGGPTPAAMGVPFTGGSQEVITITGNIELPDVSDVNLQWAQIDEFGALTVFRGAWMRLMRLG